MLPPPSTIPDDPLFADQWYLDNTGQNGGTPGKDIDVLGAWSYATGTGVTIVVNDTGVDYTNPDIAPNYDAATSGNLDAPTNSGYPYNTDELTGSDADDLAHGTAVAGLIAAAKNDYGIIGVAYDATISSFRVIDTAAADNNIFSGLADAFNNEVTDNFDIANNSWEFTAALEDSVFAPGVSTATSALLNAATVGRNGLGTINVFAAGNYYTQGDDTNLHAFQSSINVITVAALDDNGTVNAPSSEGGRYSTPGTTILVSAPGTDIVSDNLIGSGGSLAGFAADGYASINDGAQVFGLDGTSFAAPLVSGVIALMLQVNPNLGLRDVQEILAYTAVQTDPTDSTWLINDADNWNGGGLHVSRDYGFGLVDATAAVALAQSWPLQETIANRTVDSLNVNSAGAIAGGGTTFTFTVTSADELTLQWVRVQLDLSFASYGNLKVVLTSPGGARSLLLDGPNDGIGGDEVDTELQLTSDQFWGQTSIGTWRLTISDVSGTSSTGTLFSTTNDPTDLVLVGDPVSDNGLYVYTDEYASELATDASRGTLTASNGDNTLDLAAVTTNCVIDPAPGAVCTIDGAPLTIGADTTITTEIGGNGDDTFIGAPGSHTIDGGEGTNTIDYSDAPAAVTVNLSAGTASNGFGGTDSFTDIQDFVGGAGNDVFIGGPGNWTIDGGGGVESVVYSGDQANYSISSSNGVLTVIDERSGSPNGTQTLSNINLLQFANGTLPVGLITGSPSTVFDGAGDDFLRDGGSDLFMSSGTGQLLVSEINASDALLGSASFTVGGTPLPADDAATIIGAGEDYVGDGDRDVFYRNVQGQLYGWQFAAGEALVSNLFFTVGGTPVPIDTATTIVGAGEDFAGSGDRDLFYRNAAGQLFGWQFNVGGTLAGNLFFTVAGTPVPIDAATTIIGAGEDYAGSDDLDLFYRNAAGQLFGWQFSASGVLVSNLFFTVGGAPLPIDGATSIIGAGEDYSGSGDDDLFYQNAEGQLFGWQFDGNGALVSNLFFTLYGAPLGISDGTAIIGAGEDYTDVGDRDIFYRNAEGQLFGWDFNSSGALVSNLFYTVGGTPLPIDDGTTIIGAGEDYTGDGNTDLFYRNAAGQLFGWEFTAGGALAGNLFYTVGGAPVPINDGTTIIGAGEDYTGDGNTDLFYRNPAGQLFGWEFTAGGALAGNLFFNQSGVPLPIASGTTVVGVGFNVLGPGGSDLFTRSSSGQLAVLEFNGAGSLTGSAAFPALGNGDSAQVLVGTTGSDTLTGRAGASTLVGDGGNDTYVFAAGVANELIINGVSGSATSGTLAFTTSVTDTNLWLDRVDDTGTASSSGNNLRIDVMGTTTGVIIDDWFAAGTPYAPLSSITAGGLTLDTQVSSLVQAMATFEVGNPSFNPTSPASPAITDPTVLAAVNADWHH